MVAVMSPLKMPTQRRLAELSPVMHQSQVNPSMLSYAKVCQGFQTRLDITQLALAKKKKKESIDGQWWIMSTLPSQTPASTVHPEGPAWEGPGGVLQTQ